MRVELEKVRTVELPCTNLPVDGSDRQLSIGRRRPGIRCLAAERLGRIEEDVARLLTGSSQHKLRVFVLRAVFAERSLVHRLRFDQKILAGRKVAHQRVGPAPVRGAYVNDSVKSMLASFQRAKRSVHGAPVRGAADADDLVAETVKYSFDRRLDGPNELLRHVPLLDIRPIGPARQK